MADQPDGLLRSLFLTAIEAVSADHRIVDHLPPQPAGRTVIVGAGKAAAAMAHATESRQPGILSGAVVTPYGHAVDCNQIEIIEAAHPIPDEAGVRAAEHMLDLVGNLGPDDLVIALISGGGSALLALPATGLDLRDKQAVTRALLRSGAPIREINTVRKHLSAIKGGRLAEAAHPARVVTLVISDVPGDEPGIVASGPTLPDESTRTGAMDILTARSIGLAPSIRAHLEAENAETPKPGDPGFANDDVAVIARAKDALDAASQFARQHDWSIELLGDAIEGEARSVALDHANLAKSLALMSRKRPHLILSGGETTVTLDQGSGSGGRNTEYLLALALALDGQAGVWAIACDTDGIDGNSAAAGAILKPDSLERARSMGLEPRNMLEHHDSGRLFAELGDLVQTGPTRTNVNDFRAILINAGTDAEVDL